MAGQLIFAYVVRENNLGKSLIGIRIFEPETFTTYMNSKKSLLALFSVIMVLAASTASFACACCAERGTYQVSTMTADTYHLDLLKNMHFGTSTELYMTAAGEDDIKGIAGAGDGDMSIVDAYMNNTWKLNFKTAGGKAGTLVLPRPSKLTTRKIDLHDTKEGDPILYKEFAFEGTVDSGSGIFKGGIVRPTKYTLIFQGRGNMCDNAEDFTDWRLQVTGSKADYAFFGKMK